MKTIVIPIFQGSEAKNILRTEILRGLISDPDIRIVLLVPTKEKKDYFSAEFSGKNIVYEVTGPFPETTLDQAFAFLRKNLVRTSTLQIKRKNTFLMTGNSLFYVFESAFSFLFGRKPIRKIVRWVDRYLVPDSRSAYVFDRFSPDLLFTAHVFGDREASLLKEAEKRSISTVGLINSWDKITSRGMVRVIPEKLIVHNEIIKTEAVRFLDMERDKIFVSGIPQYDNFFRFIPSEKSEFFSSVGLPGKNRILLICPMGKTYSDFDVDLINMITKFQLNGDIPADIGILVRFPPNDSVDISALENRELFSWEQPGVRFSLERGIDWDMREKDVLALGNELYYGAVVVCPPSSISVDAAIFDTPVINVRFKKYENLAGSPNSYYDMDHYKNIISTGGVRIVRDEQELSLWINKYCSDKNIDSTGRRDIIKQQCHFLDGKAACRISGIVLNSLARETK